MPLSNGDCRDCGKNSDELYMLRNKLWRSLELTPDDCLCIGCLSKRLGRPFTVSDFTQSPLCNKTIRGVLTANESRSATGTIEPASYRAGSSRRVSYTSERRFAGTSGRAGRLPKGPTKQQIRPNR